MKEKLKKLLYFYLKQMWFFQNAVGEVKKPLQFANEALLIITYLAVKGIDVGIGLMVLIYVLVLIVFNVLGRIMVNWGMLSYMSRVNNAQNSEFMKILKEVEEIKTILNDQRKEKTL